MTTEPYVIRVDDLEVQVIRKDIKHLHLGVYPPNGRVRVAAPLALSDQALRMAVIDRLAWIRKHQATFAAQPRQSEREMVSGESHYYLGRRYRLRVVESPGPSRVTVPNRSTIELSVRAGIGVEERQLVLQRWYRERLRELVPPILDKWQGIIEVHAAAWGIKRMKTKWGACTVEAQRIWLNLELAKKPVQCLEYVIVHELTHLVERHHNERFVSLMDGYLPSWRNVRDVLNQEPLAHAEWTY